MRSPDSLAEWGYQTGRIHTQPTRFRFGLGIETLPCFVGLIQALFETGNQIGLSAHILRERNKAEMTPLRLSSFRPTDPVTVSTTNTM